MRLLPVTVLSLAAVVLAACGSDGGTTSSSSPAPAGSSVRPSATAVRADAGSGGKVSAPCDVTDPATVASVFGPVGPEKPGNVRNCEYTPTSGPIATINVFYYGTAADYAAVKSGAEDLSPPVKDVKAGDAAFVTSLPGTLTVRAGDVTYGVQVIVEGFPTKDKYAPYDAKLVQLADRIAARL